ncbi:MAG: hypothetical protein ACJATG_001270 [Dinoroseobacter sp.]|jgi:hypothetical protein
MKPSFALNLSHDGIGLLHRGRGGWLRVGDVALDDPEMNDRMAWLRKTAAGLATGGVTTKLILPNSEILYDEVPAPGPTEAEREAQVKAGLEGRTPYNVADLAYDYVITDGVARVVVVARETLEEAEAFATEHRFNPVSFVAMPPEDAPEGWFPGEPLFGTTRAAQSLLDADDPLEREDTPVRIVGQATTPNMADATPIVEVSEALPVSERAALVEEEPVADAPAQDPIPATPSFGSRRAPSKGNAPIAAPASRLGNRSARIAFVPKTDLEKAASVKPAAAAPLQDAPASAPLPPRKTREAPVTQTITKRGEATEIPTMIDDLAPASLDAAKTLFAEPPRSRRGLSIGLMVTGGLLILLLVAAIVGMLFFPSENVISEAAPEAEPIPVVQASLPAATDAEIEIEIDIDGETAAVDPVQIPAVRVGPTLLEAEAAYAETGVWQRAPDVPELADISGDQGIFLAALDPESGFGDAVALPSYEIGRDLRPVTPLPPIGPGQVFDLDENGLVVVPADGALNQEGVRVTLGRPSLVPPNRPSAASAAETAANEAAAAAANTALALLRPRARPGDAVEIIERARFGGFTIAELEGKKPRARPESVQALAAAEALADADEAGVTEISSLAVASSRSPVLRPNNIADLVANARAAQPAPIPVATAAVARAAPSIPTSASVARQATLQNAISLRRVSLIGVYGSPSSRRALVRLSSGRIVPVEVGERLDGGRVAAIGEDAIQYVKNGRNVTLALPTGG